MSIEIKLDSTVTKRVAEAFAPHATDMFNDRSGHWMAVVELAHQERTQPGAETDKEPSVKLRIVAAEIDENQGDLVASLNETFLRLLRSRTAKGTLDEALENDDA